MGLGERVARVFELVGRQKHGASEHPPPPAEDGEAHQLRLLPPQAAAIEVNELLKLEDEHSALHTAWYINNRLHLHIWLESLSFLSLQRSV